jgi:hypothetical protein
MKAFENLKLIEVENLRELYTIHGLHLNGRGKEGLADKIMMAIKDILKVKKTAPIEMKWKEEETIGFSDADNGEIVNGKNGLCQEVPVNGRQVNKVQGSDMLTCEKNIRIQEKRPRKVPKKRSPDFLWTDLEKV